MSAVIGQASGGATTLNRRRVYIIPTRYGVMLAILLFAILVGSINYDNSLGYMLTFLLGGLYLVAMLHTYRNLAGLSAKHIAADPVFVGEHMHFLVSLDNPKSHFKLQLKFSVLATESKLFKRRRVLVENELPRIDARENATVNLPIKAQTRGWHHLSRIKISSTFPLGIFVAWGFFPNKQPCLVYPKPEGQTTLPPLSNLTFQEHANAGAGTEDFRGLREYTPGDPVKRIAWKALAKNDELMSKQFGGDSDSHLILDWRHIDNEIDKEKRLSQLCLWVVIASRAQRAFSLCLPNEMIEVGSGEAHRLRCLRSLAECQ